MLVVYPMSIFPFFFNTRIWILGGENSNMPRKKNKNLKKEILYFYFLPLPWTCDLLLVNEKSEEFAG